MNADVAQWCVRHLGSAPSRELFRSKHLSEVIGVALADGREVVLKIRPASPRLASITAVQRHLHAQGFPCPAVVVGPAPLGPLVATAEAYVPPHGPPPDPAPTAATARLLAALVEAAPAADGFAGLHPAPPWVGWDHGGRGLWPVPDDLDVDLNAHAGPDWVDGTAARLRARLADASPSGVIGHVDWEAHNLDWDGETPVLVHDWDSVAIRPEAAIAGAAAAVFPANGTTTVAASVEQTAAFLESYRQARSAAWTRADEQVAWAAGLWVLTFNAKKESLGGGGGHLAHLEAELPERVARAGL